MIPSIPWASDAYSTRSEIVTLGQVVVMDMQILYQANAFLIAAKEDMGYQVTLLEGS